VDAKPKLTDEAFVKRLGELGGNKSALGRELKISSVAVAKRWKKILRLEAVDRGIVAAVIDKATRPGVIAKDKQMFQGEISNSKDRVTYELDVLGMLVSSHSIQQGILLEIQAEVKKNGKSKPYEREDMLKISDKQAALAKIYLDCHASAYNTKNMNMFVNWVLEMLKEESHDVHRKVLDRIRSAEPLFNSIFGSASSGG
jgi:hypothetical protein